ncbi:hypothetical protein KJ713_02215 [Patescibacteria group bacterium]|nr:hypothetical protein [Patescibacteria group bacterium]
MFDFSKLSDIKFLTDSNPGALASKNLFLIVFGLIIILAVIVWFLAHYLVKKSKILRKFLETKVFYLFLTLGIGGLILTFFRLAGASFLSMRLLFVIFIFSILVWAIYLIFYLAVSFPREYKEESDYKRRAKYLPRSQK